MVNTLRLLILVMSMLILRLQELLFAWTPCVCVYCDTTCRDVLFCVGRYRQDDTLELSRQLKEMLHDVERRYVRSFMENTNPYS